MGDQKTVKPTISEEVSSEIQTAKNQQIIYSVLSNFFIIVVIISGGLATFFAATEDAIAGDATRFWTAGFAFSTTIAGTLEKTFGMAKKAAGYREVKVRFQNVKLDLQFLPEDEMPDDTKEKIKEARLLKNELTK